jgi:hypothetical protein
MIAYVALLLGVLFKGLDHRRRYCRSLRSSYSIRSAPVNKSESV